ncbi:hypothetical protein JOB18_016372 [Solea senegalensis]|uniref:Uncharacterized protein n=1 Tax=Solea senegalensis TaxID=28829 RepID=A0AAV6PZY3_SOLSE|nr:hypothetical protein JOB18_016372 [Solea senegalensis]
MPEIIDKVKGDHKCKDTDWDEAGNAVLAVAEAIKTSFTGMAKTVARHQRDGEIAESYLARLMTAHDLHSGVESPDNYVRGSRGRWETHTETVIVLTRGTEVRKSPRSTVNALLCHQTVNNTIRRSLYRQGLSATKNLEDMADRGVLDCGCYGLKKTSLGEEESPNCNDEPSRPEVIKQENVGQWCIVNYDDEPHPGIILDVEEDKDAPERREDEEAAASSEEL